MHIRTRPASVNMTVEATVPTKDRPSPTEKILRFELLPTEERDHLDLDTGQVFQDFGYARLHKNQEKLIQATLTIRAAPDESYYQHNAMRYIGEVETEEHSFPSSIHCDVFIAPTAFGELAENIRGGLFPETISISFDDPPFSTVEGSPKTIPPLEYGWEPDGSGMKWHNKDHRAVRIEGVSFYYAVKKARYAEDSIRLLPLTAADPIVESKKDVGELLRYAKWTFVVILIIGAIIFFQQHR